MSSVIQFPLDLPDVHVLKTEMTHAGHLVITVESTLQGTRCRRCGQEIQEFHGYDRPLRLRHLPILDHRVYIEIRPKRYRCPYCPDHPTTTQRCSWYEPNSPHTRAFEHQVLRSLIHSTVSDVSRKLGLGAEAIEGIVNRYVAQVVDWQRFSALGVLGLDEIALTKGHRDFVTIVSARLPEGELAVLAVVPDRCKETVKTFLASIPERLKTTVKRVCTDRYDGFINAAHEVLPRARVVIDRFPVAKAYRACADSLRKQELKRLKAELPAAEYATLQGTLWLFRKPWTDLSPEEREQLERLFAHAPALKAAHTLREVLTLIFEQPLSKARARDYLQAWASLVQDSGLTCFDRFLTTLDERLDEITNYFLDRPMLRYLSSGCVEGLNNKIKVLKRRCYGILNPARLFQRLHLDLAGHRLFGCA